MSNQNTQTIPKFRTKEREKKDSTESSFNVGTKGRGGVREQNRCKRRSNDDDDDEDDKMNNNDRKRRQ